MTYLQCKNCDGTTPNFEQLPAYYDENGVLTQIFKCKNCGKEKHIPAMASGIVLSGDLFPRIETRLVCPHCGKDIQNWQDIIEECETT